MEDLTKLEMSRLEFLKLLGVSIGSILGFGFLMSTMSKMRSSGDQKVTQVESEGGFGSRKFGA